MAAFSPTSGSRSASGFSSWTPSLVPSQLTLDARTAGAGSCTPCSSQALWNGVKTWKGLPERFMRVPGAMAYGEPVRVSSSSSPLSAWATRSSRERPYGPKSALMCTRWASYVLATRGTTAAGLPRYHMESVTAGVAQFTIKGEEHRHQPIATYASSGGQQRRVEDKEREHRLPVIDRRTERRIVS